MLIPTYSQEWSFMKDGSWKTAGSFLFWTVSWCWRQFKESIIDFFHQVLTSKILHPLKNIPSVLISIALIFFCILSCSGFHPVFCNLSDLASPQQNRQGTGDRATAEGAVVFFQNQPEVRWNNWQQQKFDSFMVGLEMILGTTNRETKKSSTLI